MSLNSRLRYLVPLGAAAVTAIAVAMPQSASGSDQPKLPAKTAAQLLAAVETADVPSFTGTVVNTAHLGLPSIDAGSLGASAGSTGQIQQLVTLLTGSHTAHLAYDGPEKQRLALFMDDLSETDIVHDGTDLWTYQSTGNAYTHQGLSDDGGAAQQEVRSAMDPTQAAEKALSEIDPSTAVTVDRTARVAGRPAYQIVLAPRSADSLIGSVRIAIDSGTSMPLRVQIFPRSNAMTPAFAVGFTSLDLHTPSAATFRFTPPAGSVDGDKVVTHDITDRVPGALPQSGPPQVTDAGTSTKTVGKDWTSVLVVTGPTPLGHSLDQLATTVPAGHLIATSLLSVLITDDGRTLVGAVSPDYLEKLAAA